MKYETVIGFEVHVELSTDSKVFCGCSTRFAAPPNTQVCPVCLGLPGSLPVLNKKAMDFSLRAALALDCEVNRLTTFERKNYYYPDLPKNYQISQLREPLAENGRLEIAVGDKKKTIRINNIHLEEDAGKNVHPENAAENYSLVDLNRTGTPLLEIVSEPDIRGAEEAMAYMQALKNLLEYIEVSDCNMHEGRLRFEVNISHRPEGQTELPDFRSEMKNLGSMKTAIKCIEYETRRQCRALDRGERLTQDTRQWDEVKQRTVCIRSKETAHDYRYFPEPDLVDVEIDAAWLQSVRDTLPELPAAKKQRFVELYGYSDGVWEDEDWDYNKVLGVSDYDVLNLTANPKVANYYEETAKIYPKNPKAISNWIQTEIFPAMNERDIEGPELLFPPKDFAALIELIDKGTISGKIAKDVFAEMLVRHDAAQACPDAPPPTLDPAKIVEEKGWVQVKDTGQVEAWVDEAIADNPGPAENYAKGKDRAMGSLVGQVMKASRGKANPQMVNELIRKKLRG